MGGDQSRCLSSRVCYTGFAIYFPLGDFEMSTKCLICGQTHLKLAPLDCRIKTAVATALFESIPSAEAMLILDKSYFLEKVAVRVREIIG